MYVCLLQCGRTALPSTGVKINQSINQSINVRVSVCICVYLCIHVCDTMIRDLALIFKL